MIGERLSLFLALLLYSVPLHGRGEDSDEEEQASVFSKLSQEAKTVGQ